MKKIIITAAAVIVTMIFLLLAAAPVVNDNMAKKTAEGLADLPLPDDTEYIETVYKAGKLVGNGNGMQYFGAILIKSELPLEELKKYYSSYAENEWECVVENQINRDIKALEHPGPAFKTDITGDNYYIVYSWGSNNTIFHELDIRGH